MLLNINSFILNIKDTLYTTDIRNKLGSLQFDFDMKKKDGEITLLEKDKALTDQTLKRQKLAKNAFLAGLILAFIIASLIFRGYRVKVKTHKILDKQKNEIEHLLLNILPKEVANELQTTGVSKPRHFQEVSILFTDFKGFTSIADKMSPGELVEELNECFVAFDDIIAKYDLEKIKTIGDAYMCAGNIPSPDPDHAYKIIKAALDIQDFVERYNVTACRKRPGTLGNKNRCTYWSYCGRCGGQKEVCLRYLGKRSQYSQPYGKQWHSRQGEYFGRHV